MPKVLVFVDVNSFGRVVRALRVAATGCGGLRAGGGGPLQLNNLTLPGSLLPEVTPNVASTMADIWHHMDWVGSSLIACQRFVC